MNKLGYTSTVLDFMDGWSYVADHVNERERISFADRCGENYNVAEKIALVHSELSEALEGIRKDEMDHHIPYMKAGAVELADAVIRIMGIGKTMGWDISAAIIEKAKYNDERLDHKAEKRSGENGKRF